MIDTEAIRQKILTILKGIQINGLLWVGSVLDEADMINIAMMGKAGKHIGLHFAGSTNIEMFSADSEVESYIVYNTHTGVARRGGPVSTYAPELIRDMTYIRSFLHGAKIQGACRTLSPRNLGTRSFGDPSTAGAVYGGICGFYVDVNARSYL